MKSIFLLFFFNTRSTFLQSHTNTIVNSSMYNIKQHIYDVVTPYLHICLSYFFIITLPSLHRPPPLRVRKPSRAVLYVLLLLLLCSIRIRWPLCLHEDVVRVFSEAEDLAQNPPSCHLFASTFSENTLIPKPHRFRKPLVARDSRTFFRYGFWYKQRAVGSTKLNRRRILL